MLSFVAVCLFAKHPGSVNWRNCLESWTCEIGSVAEAWVGGIFGSVEGKQKDREGCSGLRLPFILASPGQASKETWGKCSAKWLLDCVI